MFMDFLTQALERLIYKDYHHLLGCSEQLPAPFLTVSGVTFGLVIGQWPGIFPPPHSKEFFSPVGP